MSVTIRPFFMGLVAIVATLFIASCSSEDAGKTLTVEFTTTPGLGVGLTTAGSAATGTTAAKPDIYTGSMSVVAKVVYRGSKTLVYKWTYSLPAPLGGTGTVSTNSIKVDVTGSSQFGVPLQLSGDGGWIKLEVYESNGSLSEQSETTFPVFVTFSG